MFCLFRVFAESDIQLIDVHMAGSHIYWVEAPSIASFGGIHRVMANGSGHDHVIVDGIGTGGIKGIAVDWVAGNNLFLKHYFHFFLLFFLLLSFKNFLFVYSL